MTETHPLRWPDGWKKTAADKRERGRQFIRGGYNGSLPTFAYGRNGVIEELRKLGAKNVVISTSVDVRFDGVPRSGVEPDRLNFKEPGAAIYFTLNGRQMVVAQDAFDSPAVNLRSLTLAIEAFRTLGRHGGGAMMDRAFDGFTALPPPSGMKPKRPWWQVLRYSEDLDDREFLSVAEVEARYKSLAKRYHPDAGGGEAEMRELNVARDEAVAFLKTAEV